MQFLKSVILRASTFFLACAAVQAQTTYYVNGSCGNDSWNGTSSTCSSPNGPKATVQAGIDASAAGDTVLVHEAVYDEHVFIDKANLTLNGAGSCADPDSGPFGDACVATLGPGDGAIADGNLAIVRIKEPGVTLKNFEISGKTNGDSALGAGGRTDGGGVLIKGTSFSADTHTVTIENCTISFTFMDNILWFNDSGYMTVRQCYIHHSDAPRKNIFILGGGSAGNPHVIEDCLITSGQGVVVDSSVANLTFCRNVIQGWPYWGCMGSSCFNDYPETGGGGPVNARGWRYYSNTIAGLWAQGSGAGINITNNLIIGTRNGLRVATNATVRNNTIVNPFNAVNYDETSPDATLIRDNSIGIQIQSGFNGTIENNIIAVTSDSDDAGRSTGYAGSGSAPYYTPGITGYGIAFSGLSGTLGASASIDNNNVWGFVDTDGLTETNWHSDLSACGDNTDSKCANNIEENPQFAWDTSDDTDDDMTRPYELYFDNYFLKNIRAVVDNGGSCHADVLSDNVHGATGFVDMKAHSGDFSGLGTCTYASDSGTDSPCIDWGTGGVGDEPEKNGDARNLGAFGSTDRASKSPTLRIITTTAGDGSVKRVSGAPVNGFDAPGVIQARDAGVTEVIVGFNRAVTATSNSFEIRDICDDAGLTAPTYDFSNATAFPYHVTMTWPDDTHRNKWVRIHVLGSGMDQVVDVEDGEALDGEISDLWDDLLPSGDGTAGGDGEFAVGSLVGDCDGDRGVEGASGEDDYESVTGYAGYPAGSCTSCPEDVDGDGNVDATDLNLVTTHNDNFLIRSPSCPPLKTWDNQTSLFTSTLADGDTIDTGTDGNAHSATIAIGDQNQPYIAFVQRDTGKDHIFLSRYDGTDVKIWDNGASAWTDTFINGDPIDTNATETAAEPQIAVNTNDRVYVAFRQASSGTNHIYLSRYDGADVNIWDNDAAAWTDTFANGDPIDTGTMGNASSPVIATDSQDRVYVAFLQVNSGKARLHLSRYDGMDVRIWDNGASTWTTTFGDGDPIDTGASQNVADPQIVVDSSDRVYITYTQSTSNKNRVYLTRYDGTDVEIWDNGASAWTDTFSAGDPIDNGSSNDAADLVIDRDGSDVVYVAYRQSDGSNDHVYLSRYDGSDVKIWDNGASAWTDTFTDGDPIDTGTADNAAEPDLAVDGSDRVYVAFRQSNGSNDHIYLSRYDGSDTTIWDPGSSLWTDTFSDGDPIDTGSANDAALPKVAIDTSNRVFVVFRQSDGTNNRIYVSRYDGSEVGIWDHDNFGWVDTFSGGDPVDTQAGSDADEPALVTDLLEQVYITFNQVGTGNKTRIHLDRY